MSIGFGDVEASRFLRLLLPKLLDAELARNNPDDEDEDETRRTPSGPGVIVLGDGSLCAGGVGSRYAGLRSRIYSLCDRLCEYSVFGGDSCDGGGVYWPFAFNMAC